MVSDEGQLYTIEGFAAALIMVVTAFLVFSTATVYTPGDEHIVDMQLEQMGNDALVMMDTPDSNGGASILKEYIQKNDDSAKAEFINDFNYHLQHFSGSTEQMNDLRYAATIFYRNLTGGVASYPFTSSGENVAHEPSVMATRWVKIDHEVEKYSPTDMEDREQYVLIEVLIWHGGVEI